VTEVDRNHKLIGQIQEAVTDRKIHRYVIPPIGQSPLDVVRVYQLAFHELSGKNEAMNLAIVALFEQ
jgi:hypothetical protein